MTVSPMAITAAASPVNAASAHAATSAQDSGSSCIPPGPGQHAATAATVSAAATARAHGSRPRAAQRGGGGSGNGEWVCVGGDRAQLKRVHEVGGA